MRSYFRRTLCAAAVLASAPVLAVDDGTKEAPPAEEGSGESVTYSGIGLVKFSASSFMPDSSTTLNFDDSIGLNVVLGFRIPTLPIFSAELEFATAVFPGQAHVTQCSSSLGGGGGLLGGGGSGSSNCSTSDAGDFGVNSAGVYAVFRSTGEFYGMGKIGYRYLGTNVEGFPKKRNGTAYAGGLGYRWNPRKNQGVEFVYNRLSDEIKYLGFNISYGFGGRD